MPMIAPGAEYIMSSTAAATSSAPSSRSNADRVGADATTSDTPNPARDHSPFDNLVGLATTPAATVRGRGHGDAAKGQASGQELAATGAATGTPGSGPSSDLPGAAAAPPGLSAGLNDNPEVTDGSTQTGAASGQPPHMPPTGASPLADGLANPVSGPGGQTDTPNSNPATGHRDPLSVASLTATHIAPPGEWSDQRRPEFVGDINTAGRSPALAGSEPRETLPIQPSSTAGTAGTTAIPTGSAWQIEASNPGFPSVTASTAAAATISGSGVSGPDLQAPQAGATQQTQANPAAAAPIIASAAGLAGPMPAAAKSLAKNLDAGSLAKTAPDNNAAAVTATGATRGPEAALAAAQTETTLPATSQDAKPPVMATLSPASTPPQAQTSATAPTLAVAPAAATAIPAAAAATTPAAAATAIDPAAPANPAASASIPAQSQAAGTVNAAAAEASPAGRFAQARQGVDERDGSLASTRSKGKSSASAAGQAGTKHQATGSSPQPQSNTGQSSAPRPDTAAAMRDLPVSTPPAPPVAAAPLAGDAVRVPTASLDTTLTTMTSSGPGSVRGAPGSAAEAGANQAPRFSQQAANQLAAQISQRFSNGSRVFGIRLDPAELGRVDIRLELSQNNRVHATLTVERGETLVEMQRSTRELERALNDAGLELAEDGLNFQLSEGSGDDQSAEPEQGKSTNVYGQDEAGAQDLAAEIDTGPGDAYGFRLSRRDGVDLRV